MARFGRAIRRRALLRLVPIAIAALLAASQALAGGDEYDAAKDVENLGPAYFGFVRDARGLAGVRCPGDR